MAEFFPHDKYEALTMLYLQQQDISNLTPEELLQKYEEVYEVMYRKVKEAHQRIQNTWFEPKSNTNN